MGAEQRLPALPGPPRSSGTRRTLIGPGRRSAERRRARPGDEDENVDGNGAVLPRMAPQSPAAPAPPVPAAPLPALPASPAASPRSQSTGTGPSPLPAARPRPPLTFGAPGLVSRAG